MLIIHIMKFPLLLKMENIANIIWNIGRIYHILELALMLQVIITKRFAKVKSLIKYFKLIDQNIIPIDEKTIEIVDEMEEKN